MSRIQLRRHDLGQRFPIHAALECLHTMHMDFIIRGQKQYSLIGCNVRQPSLLADRMVLILLAGANP